MTPEHPYVPTIEPEIVGRCASCSGAIYDYEYATCEQCSTDLHVGCVVTCAQCGNEGCRSCIPPDPDYMKYFCATGEGVSKCKEAFMSGRLETDNAACSGQIVPCQKDPNQRKQNSVPPAHHF